MVRFFNLQSYSYRFHKLLFSYLHSKTQFKLLPTESKVFMLIQYTPIFHYKMKMMVKIKCDYIFS